MRRAIRSTQFLAVAMILAASANAQEVPRLEAGTQAGVTFLRSGGDGVTMIGVPGGTLVGQPSIYVSFFAGPNVAVEPHVNVNRISSGGSSVTAIGLVGRVKYFVNGVATSSTYFFGDGALLYASAMESSDTEFGAGGGIGRRSLIGEALSIHIEGRYRRWFSDFQGTNEFAVAVGLGAVVGPG